RARLPHPPELGLEQVGNPARRGQLDLELLEPALLPGSVGPRPRELPLGALQPREQGRRRRAGAADETPREPRVRLPQRLVRLLEPPELGLYVHCTACSRSRAASSRTTRSMCGSPTVNVFDPSRTR